MEIPRVTILEYELIINQKLYDQGIITEQQYNDVYKIISDKIKRFNK